MLKYEIENPAKKPGAAPSGGKGLLRRLFRERTGATAIEFALLALPFMLVVFATLETFVAFTGEQLLANATETMARKIRTGEITSGVNPATDMDQEGFRQAFCDEIAILMTCSPTEVATASKLFIDVRSYDKFSDIPTDIPRQVASDRSSDFNPTGFKFDPGGPKSINVVRAFYRWDVATDLVRPYVTNLRPAGSSMPHDYLMVSTATFVNENY